MLRRREFVAGMTALLAGCALPRAAPSAKGPPLYVARRGVAKVTIFGVAAPTDRSWLNPAIEAALIESHELWQENPASPQTFNQELNEKLGRRSEGSLFDDLTPQQAERVLNLAQKAGMRRDMIETLLPWAVGGRLSFLTFQNPVTAPVKYDNVEGVLQQLAEARGIPVRSEFADWDDFPRLFSSFSKQEQVQYLMYTLDNIERPPGKQAELTAAWLKGDVSGFEKASKNLRTRYPELYTKIEIERNTRWADRIDDMLARGGSYFIDVGVYHTVGPDSIQAHLGRRGTLVRRL